ncbi:hypothetical protein GCM10010449_84360 [Streptomyces rectiviolaceus]|uniref:Restriction endonuclease type IV Mrr domain-containing protein n=2 Tax=Streptomyces rectiviolaceus TaxID=332591 RepID=A0ABP6NNA4_9ACTN
MRYSLGSIVGVCLVLIIVAMTYPWQTGAIVVILAAAKILAAVRPRRLAALFARVDRVSAAIPARPALPRRGARTLDAFRGMKPARFEQAIAELAQGDDRVLAAHPVGGSGDGGIDVRVKLHNGTAWFIQCKRNQRGNNVPPQVIRDANGAYRDLHHCHHAAVITTADFTRQAYETNRRFRSPLTLFTGHDVAAWANGTGPAPWDVPIHHGG